MTFKEKIESKQFWAAVLVFTIGFTFISNLFTLWWSHDFNFAEFRANRFFEDNLFLFVLSEAVKSSIIAFFVVLISFKGERKEAHISKANS